VDVATAELDDELERALLRPDADVEPPTSTVEKELSRELNTTTLGLLINLVPSTGRVKNG
jgi:multisubunit Na+/H+ antiporter MnhE subunit